MLNPQWLRTFGALVEIGNFTRAAERLNLTQAAVSQHLRHLEDELGLLVIRRPRGIELTPAGQALIDYCAETELARKRLDSRLAGRDDDTGEIGVISPGSIGLALFPLLLDWQERHPEWKMRHRFAPDSEVLEAILENRYDIGFVTLKPDDTRLAASKFSEEPLELVVPKGARVHEWRDLEALGFIDHPDGQAMANRLLSRRFPGHPGIRALTRHGFSNQIGLILEFVARGLGFTVIPRYARVAFGGQDAIEVVECGEPLVDTLWLIHRAEWPLAARCARVVEYLRACMKPSS
ncbi:Transcriptional regulator, LysR family [Candidatus Burkholderia verschuerenii]|uniref:Transcriptional regulator, LysR family n=1 Tax=Candidatus Burkholderia verschuerenii TaxID=242163 RepID=A0A0L0MIH7_9BURK|nr:LysR family transcriptional regulator [Candidatus Burkholderia verschuerenii]KND62086.1 Transcriptional regulator, LysR family [Candidatus Burkholderia verschuerenii]